MKTAIIGLQFGDCGKGKVSGYLGKDCKWFVRFNGGPNAGHTVYSMKRKYKFHHLPAGAAESFKNVVLDAGMVIDIDGLKQELAGIKHTINLYISKSVHLIQPEHKDKDFGGSGIGSTKKGIAYVYADRALRKGKIVGEQDLGLPKRYVAYDGLPPIGENEDVIYEGAQGIMLDVDYGAYPYVTSSSIMPSMAHKIDRTVGVMKAYTTRVGDGPPYSSDIEELRDRGQEFGTTTGRPRRCTWNDMQQLEYAMSIVQPDEIAVTKLDIVDGMNICVWDNGSLREIGNLDNYCNFLLEKFPKIKYFSKSPLNEMEEL